MDNSSVKAAANLMGAHVGATRKPVLGLNDKDMADLREALRPLGLK